MKLFTIASLLMVFAALFFLVVGILYGTVSFTIYSLLFAIAAVVFTKIGTHKALQL